MDDDHNDGDHGDANGNVTIMIKTIISIMIRIACQYLEQRCLHLLIVAMLLKHVFVIFMFVFVMHVCVCMHV